MLNRISKLVVFCAMLTASTAASAAFLKIAVAPATSFPPGAQLKVIGQAAGLPNGGVHPVELQLKAGRTDGSWNFMGRRFTSTQVVNFGAPNAANWSSANFVPLAAPPFSPFHKMKMVETILIWVPIGAPDGPGEYRPMPGAPQAIALFQQRCIPVNGHPICHWERQ